LGVTAAVESAVVWVDLATKRTAAERMERPMGSILKETEKINK